MNPILNSASTSNGSSREIFPDEIELRAEEGEGGRTVEAVQKGTKVE